MLRKILSGSVLAFLVIFVASVPAQAETLPAIDFEPTIYSLGNINGQNGWSKTGSFDVEVENVSDYVNASVFGFGIQSLRISNSVTSGSFGDQTFSPGLTSPASEVGLDHFESSFSIGSALPTQQTGLFLSVSPDGGNGSRMSYVGFDDRADGIHVIFYDVTNPGPLGTVSSFNSTDVMTIDRTSAHTIKFAIDLKPGPANDVVKLYVNNVLKHEGTTWEDYYRYDPEQNGNGNLVPSIAKLLFRVGGTAATGTLGNGYLIDNVALSSSTTEVPAPANMSECKKNGWKSFVGLIFKNQGDCVSYVQSNERALGNKVNNH